MKKIKFTINPFFFYSILRSKLRLFYLQKKGIRVGKDTFISPKAYIDTHYGSTITIGSNCYITRNVIVLNHTDTYRGGPKGIWISKGGERVLKDVVIGDNVFIGVNSVIMPGVTIGDNSVIGALSFVNKSIPPNTVWAGNPAKQISTTEDMILKQFSKLNGQ